MGNYKAALPLFLQAQAITRAGSGETHPDYARRLGALAMLYMDMGDYKAALPLCQQALAIFKESLGEKHPSYALTLNDLAGLYQAMGDYKAALPLFQQARAIIRERLGEKHPSYALSLNNLADLYRVMGNDKAALPLLKQAFEIARETQGEKHPSYAVKMLNLAQLYQDMGELKAALPLLQQAQAIFKESLGEKHPIYAHGLNNLASLRLALGQTGQARVLSEQSLDLTHGDLRLAASVQSERQQMAAVQAVRERLNLRLSLPDPEGPGPDASYRHVLLWKGAVFARQQHRRLFTRLLAADSRSEVRRLVEELEQATRLLAAVALAPADGPRRRLGARNWKNSPARRKTLRLACRVSAPSSPPAGNSLPLRRLLCGRRCPRESPWWISSSTPITTALSLTARRATRAV